ncbi:MAG TPA: hypothetical protein VFF79_06575 [Conexibacter sp.]|jgi:hypothetical protein|nr:hypothetical protein [Conexibacter sp.]
MSIHAIVRALPHSSRRDAVGQAVAAVAVAAVAAALTLFVTSQRTLSGAAAVLVVAGSLWLATTRRTAPALALLMVYLGALDGYVKLATGSQYATFIRDVLLYAFVVGLLVRATAHRTRLPTPPLSGWALAFVVLVLVQLLNPQAGSLVHSLAGVRQHLEFVPLFFLTFAFVRTTKALRAFVILLAALAAANGAVGWVQFDETPQQLAAWGPGYAQRVLGQGNFQLSGRTFASQSGQNRTRPFGLGSDAGAGGVFGAFALGGILALASLFTRMRYLLLAVVLAIGASTAIITSQGRGVIVCSVIVVLAYGLLTATSQGRVTSLLGLGLAAVVSFFVVQAIVGSSGSSALRYQGLSPSTFVQTADTARGKSIARIPGNLVKYPLGAGLATAGPASGVAPGASKLTGAVDAESELSFLTIETGIPGMLVLTGFTISLILLGLRRCRHEPDREARLLLAAVIAPVAGILALFFPSALTASIPAGPYLWAAGGIVSYWLVARPAARRRASQAAVASAPA